MNNYLIKIFDEQTKHRIGEDDLFEIRHCIGEKNLFEILQDLKKSNKTFSVYEGKCVLDFS
jgi:hypothetical protein